jgi:hypothetical protein
MPFYVDAHGPKPGLSFLGPSGRPAFRISVSLALRTTALRISVIAQASSFFYSPLFVFQSTQFELFSYFRECVDRSL